MTGLVVHGCNQLVVGPANEPDGGPGEGDGATVLETIDDGAVAIDDGEILAIGDSDTVCREYPPENADRAIDATGKLVTPGFVDPHTHALFAGDRSEEFVARIEGTTYTEIMAAGGGIPVTVEAVREASDGTLLENLLAQLDVMLAHGTTTAEVKSGYGLDTETELRMLDVIARADERHPVDLIPTFMGGHGVPDGMETDSYVESVVSEQLPAVADQGIAEFCDVFCEEGVFDVEQSRRILEAGQEYGLDAKIHAEEFSHIGGAQLAADLGAVSADHLLQATESDAAALATAGVTPVLLPATAFALGEAYADPSPHLAADAPVALGSDLNPSCYVHNMGLVVSLACLRMGMHPATALLGATANAARAISRTDGTGMSRTGTLRTGTLRTGTAGDLVVFDHPDYLHLPYNVGSNRVETVVKEGRVVHRNTSAPRSQNGGDTR